MGGTESEKQMGQICGLYQVDQSTIAIKERCGKFYKVDGPGCHCVPWCCCVTVAGVLSLRVQQLDVRCETKTKVWFFSPQTHHHHARAFECLFYPFDWSSMLLSLSLCLSVSLCVSSLYFALSVVSDQSLKLKQWQIHQLSFFLESNHNMDCKEIRRGAFDLRCRTMSL
jgi:hypothetical protein